MRHVTHENAACHTTTHYYTDTLLHTTTAHMTVSTEIATSLESTKSRHSNSSVQIQMKPQSQFEFVPRDTEKSEFLDLVDSGGVAILVETVIPFPRDSQGIPCDIICLSHT